MESNIGNHFFSLQAETFSLLRNFSFFFLDGPKYFTQRKWLYFYTRLMMFIIKTFSIVNHSFLNQSNGLCENSCAVCLLAKNMKINLTFAGESSKISFNNDLKSF